MLFTVVEGDGLKAKLLVKSRAAVGDGRQGRARPARGAEIQRSARNRLLELEDGRKVFAEVYGRRLARSSTAPSTRPRRSGRGAKLLGWTAIVADARGAFATRSESRARTS